jgi:LysM repeat protein
MSRISGVVEPSAAARQDPAAGSGRVAQSVRATHVDRANRPVRGSRPSVRLTRRGRALLLSVIALVLALGGVAVGRGVAAAGTLSPEAVPVSVVVQAGETLWQIAGRIAPGVDRRVTVDQLQEANGLTGSLVVPGQSLVVPATS